MNNLIAISIGDINGIGIEILIDTWRKNKIKNFILFTDKKEIKNYLKIKNINIKLHIVNENSKIINYNKTKFNIFTYESKSSEDNTYKSLKYVYNNCINNICIGIITLPLRKDLIKRKINKKFIGHTEFFQQIDKKKYSNMILFHDKIIISPITTHIKLKNITKKIRSKKFFFNQILNLNRTLKKDFNYKYPKLIISGLNPHAGEEGTIGKEEKEIINPILTKLRSKGVNIKGPFSADSMLIKNNINKFDCFIFIYHDQALIPFKYISQFTGVNFTGNLSIIRTSPDHGTAYNLIGTNKYTNKSLINCYKLVKKIYKNRLINDQT